MIDLDEKGRPKFGQSIPVEPDITDEVKDLWNEVADLRQQLQDINDAVWTLEEKVKKVR